MSELDNTETQNTAPVETQAQPTEQTAPISTAQVREAKESYDLDLDLLQPQSKHVKLNGKVYEVFPPKLKDITNLSRLAGKLSEAEGEDLQTIIEKMLSAFVNIMPDLKNDDVDLSVEQLTALYGFVNRMSSPAENSALKKMGIEPAAEKKVVAE